MFKSDDEKTITVIGDAVLTLLNNNADISAASLSSALRQMHDAETDDARRQLTGHAIELTGKLFSNAACTGEDTPEQSQPDTAQPLPVSRH
ncbi:hypothetical protein [Pantoea ananatis]|uniref:Uncharacterized protein n=1 Tax=Pantoea ananas TaxID=553 RepID=A0AAJ1D381_PANAN|nr:hypothetical protein [Pantoea ananatis]ASN13816.1 hypothetical protein B7764_00820 [Pantoea ananatis]AVG78985.1 hypothetical protein B9Q16_23635 [Pantoea ananatis]MCW0314708.1 hypothetical protein [Pantoea ananatis]MCW0346372.1 hypothetical protein [Pantoea ananatis]PQK70038.1 hypothetical protein CG427_20990 [Pantoea ananatis]